MSLALQAHGLVKQFGPTTALAGVDLQVRSGTVLALVGPNGAGKSTTIRILATLLQPDRGWARVAGLDVVRDAAQVRRMIGLTGQYAAVDEDLTGLENLVLIGRLLDLTAADARSRARELLDEFELADAAGRRARTYSGGMRRRLDLAASLVGDPRVVFLDEPTTGLDPGKRVHMWERIRSMRDAGGTVLLTTQYLEEADALADEITVIDHGRVVAHDTPAGLKQVVGGQTVAVRPSDPALLDRAAQVMARATRQPVAPPTGGILSVPVEGQADFTRIVGQLTDAAVPVAEIALRLPSLDDVFFMLAGRPADEPSLEVAQ